MEDSGNTKRTFSFFCLHVVHARAVLSPRRGRLGARKLAIVSKELFYTSLEKGSNKDNKKRPSPAPVKEQNPWRSFRLFSNKAPRKAIRTLLIRGRRLL